MYWDPNVGLKFVDEFLDFLRATVKADAGVYSVQFLPPYKGIGVILEKEDDRKPGDERGSFIPTWWFDHLAQHRSASLH